MQHSGSAYKSGNKEERAKLSDATDATQSVCRGSCMCKTMSNDSRNMLAGTMLMSRQTCSAIEV